MMREHSQHSSSRKVPPTNDTDRLSRRELKPRPTQKNIDRQPSPLGRPPLAPTALLPLSDDDVKTIHTGTHKASVVEWIDAAPPLAHSTSDALPQSSTDATSSDYFNNDSTTEALHRVVLSQLLDVKRPYIVGAFIEEAPDIHSRMLHEPITVATLMHVLCSSAPNPPDAVPTSTAEARCGSPRSQSSPRSPATLRSPSPARRSSSYLLRSPSLKSNPQRTSTFGPSEPMLELSQASRRELHLLLQRCDVQGLARQGETLATLMHYDIPRELPLLQQSTLNALAVAASECPIVTTQQIRALVQDDAFLNPPAPLPSSFMFPNAAGQRQCAHPNPDDVAASAERKKERRIAEVLDCFTKYTCRAAPIAHHHHKQSQNVSPSSSEEDNDENGSDSDDSDDEGDGVGHISSIVLLELADKLSKPTERLRYSRKFASDTVHTMRTLGSSILYLALLIAVIAWVATIDLWPRYASWLSASSPGEAWENYCSNGGVVGGFCHMEWRELETNVVAAVEAARFFQAEVVNSLWIFAEEAAEANHHAEYNSSSYTSAITAAMVPYEGSLLVGALLLRMSPTVDEPPSTAPFYSCAANNISVPVEEPYLSVSFDCSSWKTTVIPFNVTKEVALEHARQFLLEVPEWTIASLVMQYALYNPSTGNLAWATVSLGLPRYGGIVSRFRIEVLDTTLHDLIYTCVFASSVLVAADIIVFVALFTYQDGFTAALFNVCLRVSLFGFVVGSYSMIGKLDSIENLLQTEYIINGLDSVVVASQQSEMLFGIWIFVLIAIVTQFIGHVEGLQTVVKLVAIILPELLGLFVVFGFFYVGFLMVAMIAFGSTIDLYASFFNANAALIQYFFLDTDLGSFVGNYPQTGYAFYYIFRCFLFFVVTNFCIVTIIAPIKTVWLEGDLPVIVANVWVHSSPKSLTKRADGGVGSSSSSERKQSGGGVSRRKFDHSRGANTAEPPPQRQKTTFAAKFYSHYRVYLRRVFLIAISVIVFFINSTPLFLRHWLRFTRILDDLYQPNVPLHRKITASQHLLNLYDDHKDDAPYSSDILAVTRTTRAAHTPASLAVCIAVISSESTYEWLRDARLLSMLNSFDEFSTRITAAMNAEEEDREEVAPLVSKDDILAAVGVTAQAPAPLGQPPQPPRRARERLTEHERDGNTTAVELSEPLIRPIAAPNGADRAQRNYNDTTLGRRGEPPTASGDDDDDDADDGIVDVHKVAPPAHQFHFTHFILEHLLETDFFNERYFLLYTISHRIILILLYAVMVTTVVNTRRDVAYLTKNLHSGIRDLPVRQSCKDDNCTVAFTKKWTYMDNERLEHLKMFTHRRLQYSLFRDAIPSDAEEDETVPNLSGLADDVTVSWDSYIVRHGPVEIRQIRGQPIPCQPLPSFVRQSLASSTPPERHRLESFNCSSALDFQRDATIPRPHDSLLDEEAYKFQPAHCAEDPIQGTLTTQGFYQQRWPCMGYSALVHNTSQLLYAVDHWLGAETIFVAIAMKFYSSGKGPIISESTPVVSVQYILYAEFAQGGASGQFFVRTTALRDPFLDTISDTGIILMSVDFAMGLIGVVVPLAYAYRHARYRLHKKPIVTLRSVVYVVYFALVMDQIQRSNDEGGDKSSQTALVAGLILVIWLTCSILFNVLFPAALFVFRRVTIVNDFIALAFLRVVQLVPLFSILVTAFSIAGHIMWGSRMREFATLYHSFLAVMEGLLGDFDLVDDMFALDAAYAFLFTLLMLAVMVILALNLLLAVIAGCAEEAREHTRIVGAIEAVASVMNRRVYFGPMFGVLMGKFLGKSKKREMLPLMAVLEQQQQQRRAVEEDVGQRQRLAERNARSPERRKREELRRIGAQSFLNESASSAALPLAPSAESRRSLLPQDATTTQGAVTSSSSLNQKILERRSLPVKGVFGFLLRFLFPSVNGFRARFLRRLFCVPGSTSAVNSHTNAADEQKSPLLDSLMAEAVLLPPVQLHTTEDARLPLPLECLAKHMSPLLFYELVDCLHIGRQPESMQCSSVAFLLQQFQLFSRQHPERCYLDALKECALSRHLLQRATTTAQQRERTDREGELQRPTKRNDTMSQPRPPPPALSAKISTQDSACDEDTELDKLLEHDEQ